ncbi:sensor histidine kinase [Pseudoduganella sp. OTU4001]|uniref:sensor histidine kinase n=1 Tax=Pseudoduganella sp. OTU4001 TaxID=3043854 RepID=UPI00313B7437
MPTEQVRLRPPTVLVVDDSPTLLLALLDHLSRHGFLVVLAHDAREGMMRAALAEPDLILLDIVMPGLDGFEACRRLKADAGTRDVPVIFMTGLSDAKQIVSGFAVGGVDYITKPFQVEEVLARINTHIALRRANSELKQAYESLARAQEDLVHQEKLAALGALVAGIAHELNTPIGNSLMVASTFDAQTGEMREHFSKGETLRRSELVSYLDNACTTTEILMRNLQRAADMVTNFKQVAVDQTSTQRRTFLLSEVVAGNVLTLMPSIKRTPFEVVQTIPVELMMDSYPGPLGQVIANLVNNAIMHAFDGRCEGKVELVAEYEKSDWIALHVRDNGNGISNANQERIFDPFFTTKMGVGGSGLGLHIVHSIVSDILGGRISVRSEEGSGTCFTLSLPMEAPRH